ncbi:MAG TPA: ABC transporter permease subunit [Kiritimatiellia bacterium]|jgi:microcin C transport system permease protein|nr:ABC transporter permease subunit [Lentisphaerota bacterium]HPC19563.1 ABC transporter permease subunit [Kiritimatiellia bacterium]
MERLDYLLRRLLLMGPTFVGITLVCFALCQAVPGGPVEQALAKMRGMGAGAAGRSPHAGAAVSAEQKKALEEHFGFDRPLLRRYWNWLVQDKMGLAARSYKYPNKTVGRLIADRFRISLVFGISGFVLTYLICIPLGIAKALRHGSAFDAASSVVVFVGYAIPAFAFGMLLKMLFAGTGEGFWDILPAAGVVSVNYELLSLWGKFKDLAAHFVLPVSCYVIGNFAVLTLLMKNSLLEQIGQDYVRTVLAKGGSLQRAVWGHAFRNALIPIATGFGGVLGILFAGSVLIEKVFEIPGMGLLSLDAIVSRDYMVFMSILAVTSVLGLLGRLLSDACYLLIDPRIQFD